MVEGLGFRIVAKILGNRPDPGRHDKVNAAAHPAVTGFVNQDTSAGVTRKRARV